MSIIVDSSRRFQLWRATVGHGQVLLRSPKTAADPTRIDVLFKPVGAIKIRTTLRGLLVREGSSEEMRKIASDSGESLNAEFKAYVIESETFTGYVVASVALVVEDKGEYDEPSSLYVGQGVL